MRYQLQFYDVSLKIALNSTLVPIDYILDTNYYDLNNSCFSINASSNVNSNPIGSKPQDELTPQDNSICKSNHTPIPRRCFEIEG